MISVSVITPVRDEGSNIEALLDDLLRQRRPAREILIVDTGSADDTRERVLRVSRRDARVRLVEAPGALPGGGRNAGLRAATGDWVAFIDGGMRVDEEWLAALMAPVDRGEPLDVVLGGMEPVAETRFARAASLAFVPARRPTPSGGSWRGYCLPSSAVRTELARAAGFPEALRSGEDLVFFQRLSVNARIAYAPDAIVRWRHAATPSQLWRRFRVYAEHSFKGGLMDDWFRPMSRRYLFLALMGPALLPSALLLLFARAFVMQRRKPELTDSATGERILQLAEVALCLGIIDAATFAAWIAWRRDGRPRSVEPAPMNVTAPAGHQPSRAARGE